MDSQRPLQIDSRHGLIYMVGGDQHNHFDTPEGIEKRLGGDSTAQILQRLQPALMNAVDRAECLKGTRADIIKMVKDWASSGDTPHSMLWLHGLTGSGKSTVATTIANLFSEMGCLGAFLFFDRDIPERNDPSTVIRTLAWQLGTNNTGAGAEIASAIKNFPTVHLSPLHLQFQHLLIDPLSAEGAVDKGKPTILVLDALDECGSVKQRERLLDVLVEGCKRLPQNVRTVIMSRCEHDIQGAFDGQTHLFSRELDITSVSNTKDISSYLSHHMLRIRRKNSRLWLGSDWPSNDDIRKLTEQAYGLFVWASTALEFINGYDPRALTEILLEQGPTSGAEDALDALYRTALGPAGNWEDKMFVSDFTAVVGLVLVARSPLTSTTIDLLLCGRPCLHTISHLGCVLQSHPTLRLLHPSFADFLTTESRCGRDIWFFDLTVHHRTLASQCLRHLDMVLRRNMCNMTLSTPRAHQLLSEDVTYACVFLIDHLSILSVGDADPIIEQLHEFLYKHLLHWFEAMSVLKRSRDTIELLDRLAAWVSNCSPRRHGLHDLVQDACRFARVFALSMQEHPLLIYMTALPFTPVNTALHRAFRDKEANPILKLGRQQSWSQLVLVTEHTDAVNSVAFSPDGSRIVSGSSDTTIRVWDATSAAEVLPPMRQHKSSVTSVAYSPDGSRIVSGSHDHTLRLWDAATGAEIHPVMRGHDSAVKSVAFSPDGKLIASGSWDNTVRVWDTASGLEKYPALLGHESHVNSVAFSHDGTKIVSGSDDKTIRFWDAISGTKTSPIIRGHRDIVSSVSFSPKGTQVLSGSSDGSARLWDAISGEEILPTMWQDTVLSVAFSPDGNRIVSGGASTDTTIRVWDTSKGCEALPALRGHERWVNSVSFSPDGRRIVSCSGDHTIRVWDATSSESADAVALGHEGEVTTIAFSPDGSQIISSSNDKTIRLWDIETGEKLLQMSPGHIVKWLGFSEDGAYITSASSDHSSRFWDAKSGVEIPTPPGIKPTIHISDEAMINYLNAVSDMGCLPSPGRHEYDDLYVSRPSFPTSPISPTMFSGPDGVAIPTVKISDDEAKSTYLSPASGRDGLTFSPQHATDIMSPPPSSSLSSAMLSPFGTVIAMPTRIASSSAVTINSSTPSGHTEDVMPLHPGGDAEAIYSSHISNIDLPEIKEPRSRSRSPDLPMVLVSSASTELWASTETSDVANQAGLGFGLRPPTDGPRHRRTISTVSQDGSHTSVSSDNRSLKSPRQVPLEDSSDPHSVSNIPRIKVTHDGWIVDSTTNRTLSKLPTMVKITCSEAHGHSVAFGTVTGRLFVLQFPAALFTSPDTRTDYKRKRQGEISPFSISPSQLSPAMPHSTVDFDTRRVRPRWSENDTTTGSTQI